MNFVCPIVPREEGFLIETMYYADEIKDISRSYARPVVSDAEISMAKTLIDSMEQPFEPALYKDEYQEEKGKELYALAEQQCLEGIVAKLKDSKYYFDKRTKEWIKIKHLLDDDFVICGFIYKDNGVVSLVLGKYGKGGLEYKGHVSLGLSNAAFEQVKSCPPAKTEPFPAANNAVYWIQPLLVCTEIS